MKVNKQTRVLVMGQHFTSRTEAIRDYLLSRVNNVYVIAFGSPFLNKIENHFFFYEDNHLKRHVVFSHPIISKVRFHGLRVMATFSAYCLDIAKSLFLIRRKVDLAIGVARFSGFICSVIKLFGLFKQSIYYSIDYYLPVGRIRLFDRFFVCISDIAEKFIILLSIEVWDISRRISKARSLLRGILLRDYTHKLRVVPLGYSNTFFRNKERSESDKYSLVFAGVVVEGQGLELIADILPELKKEFPSIKIKIIGTGPYLPVFRRKVEESGIGDSFLFYGFIEEIGKMLDVISTSGVGVSLWNKENNGANFYFGDPGKTKLYSVCGLPVIVSKETVYAKIVGDNCCGLAIGYRRQELLKAVKALFSDESVYKKYKMNTLATARDYCSSEKIFSQVLQS